MQVGQCGSQMDTRFWELLCDENGIGGGGESCGGSDALRPRVRRNRRCNPKSPLGELFRLGNFVNQNAGAGSI
jgi:hypothetical protein